jgi:WD40 repeat protein
VLAGLGLAILLAGVVAVVVAAVGRPSGSGEPPDGGGTVTAGPATDPGSKNPTKGTVKEPVKEEPPPKAKAMVPPGLLHDLTGHTGTVQCLAFTTDGKTLASGSDDQQVRLWDTATGGETQKPLRLGNPVTALAWSPDGKRLATAVSRPGQTAVRLWDAASRQELPKLAPGKAGATIGTVRSLAFSPDGKRLAAAGGPIHVWDLDKGGTPLTLAWQTSVPSYTYGVAISPDGRIVAAGCHEWMKDKVRLWDLTAPEEPTVLSGNDDAHGLSHEDVRAALAFDRRGRLLVRVTSSSANSPSASARLWDVGPKAEKVTLRDTLPLPGGMVYALAVMPDGSLRVAAAAGTPRLFPGAGPPKGASDVKLWDSATGKARTLATGHRQPVTCLAFSADGSTLATGSADYAVRLWNVGRP